jgi:hypothetical protein
MAPNDAQITEWFAEFRRLATEAAERFDAGDLRPALASLAAVPMVHSTLMERCSNLAEGQPSNTEEDNEVHGLYL